MSMLQAGDKARDFKAVDQNGTLHTLKEYRGKKVALYFYPQDDTETCTKQACNLRDNFELLTEKGIIVLGVSPDTEKSHKKFEQKFSLPFTLLADPERKILNAYGVWQWKTFMGRTFMGTLRTTFLINEKGKIEHVIERVTSGKHAQQIIDLWML